MFSCSKTRSRIATFGMICNWRRPTEPAEKPACCGLPGSCNRRIRDRQRQIPSSGVRPVSRAMSPTLQHDRLLHPCDFRVWASYMRAPAVVGTREPKPSLLRVTGVGGGHRQPGCLQGGGHSYIQTVDGFHQRSVQDNVVLQTPGALPQRGLPNTYPPSRS